MSPSEQEPQRVDVRAVWAHEALDFTPWLAQNLDLLGEELGLRLELIMPEKPVGPFFLDILAKDTDTSDLVAIENQLEWTDFNHLGQLLTYATGCNAQAAIWVAPEFRYELAEALHRLNDWTGAGISFYGVKIEAALVAGNSDPEPRFRKVVYPGGWNKGETQPPGQSESPDARRLREFFEPLNAEVARTGILPATPVRLFDHTGRYFPSPRNQGIWYATTLEGATDAWVSCHIRTADNVLTKRIFDTLRGRAQPYRGSDRCRPCAAMALAPPRQMDLLQRQHQEGRFDRRSAGGTRPDPDMDARPLAQVHESVRPTSSEDPRQGTPGTPVSPTSFAPNMDADALPSTAANGS